MTLKNHIEDCYPLSNVNSLMVYDDGEARVFMLTVETKKYIAKLGPTANIENLLRHNAYISEMSPHGLHILNTMEGRECAQCGPGRMIVVYEYIEGYTLEELVTSYACSHRLASATGKALALFHRELNGIRNGRIQASGGIVGLIHGDFNLANLICTDTATHDLRFIDFDNTRVDGFEVDLFEMLIDLYVVAAKDEYAKVLACAFVEGYNHHASVKLPTKATLLQSGEHYEKAQFTYHHNRAKMLGTNSWEERFFAKYPVLCNLINEII